MQATALPSPPPPPPLLLLLLVVMVLLSLLLMACAPSRHRLRLVSATDLPGTAESVDRGSASVVPKIFPIVPVECQFLLLLLLLLRKPCR